MALAKRRHFRTACRNSPCAIGRQAGWHLRPRCWWVRPGGHLGRSRGWVTLGRRRPGRVPRMLPHPGFEIPDPFLQTDVRRPEVNDHCPLPGDCQLQLNNQCLQGCGQGRVTQQNVKGNPLGTLTRHPYSAPYPRERLRMRGPRRGCPPDPAVPATDERKGRALVPDRPARMPVPVIAGERGRASTCTGHVRGVLQQLPTGPRHQGPHPPLSPRYLVNNLVRDNS